MSEQGLCLGCEFCEPNIEEKQMSDYVPSKYPELHKAIFTPETNQTTSSETTTTMQMETYPCSAGMRLPQGFHKFIFSNGAVLCELCGFVKGETSG